MSATAIALGLTAVWILLAIATLPVLAFAVRRASTNGLRRNPTDEGYRFLVDDHR